LRHNIPDILPKQAQKNKLYISRVLYLSLGLIVIFVSIFARINYMVQNRGDTYSETASAKSTKTITLFGTRGTIYDSNMNPLAYDRTSYDVTFYRDPSRSSAADREAYTQILLNVIRLIESNGKTTVNDFWMKQDESGQWIFTSGSSSASVENTRKGYFKTNFALGKTPEENWFETLCEKYFIPADLDTEMKVKVLALWQESRMNSFNSTPCTIAYDVGFEAMSEIQVRSMELDGIDITISSTRVYPQGETACHVIGYIGKIDSATLTDYREQGYPNNAYIGRDGIEASLESQLTPYIQYRQGSRVVEINTRGKVVRELDYTAPTDGNSVILTIDTDLQQVMAKALEDTINDIHDKQEVTIADESWQRKNAEELATYEEAGIELSLATSGALVAMDPNNGKVLGLVSHPDFDLSYFDGGSISNSDWNKIREGNDPLYNRAISTKDSPGSIFKMVTALAGLSEGAITLDTRINDLGAYTQTDATHPAKCWTKQIQNHQNQTVVEGLKNSCNYFFYEVGHALGSTNIYKWAAQLGLTSKTNIELPGETTSFVGNQNMLYDPDSPIESQYTNKPMIAANAVRNRIREIGADRGIEYDDERIDEVVKKLLDVAVSYSSKAQWNKPIREILLYDLNLPESYIVSNYLGNSMVSYISELFWTDNETIMLAIGQSITQLSPISVARYVSAIANGGTVYDAQIVDKIIAPNGSIVLDKEPVIANQISADDSYFAAIRKGMEDVTSLEDGGTAGSYFKGIDYIAAKTGTSQRTQIDVENNAWMVAYAPKVNPEIVVVAYIQNGYAGANASNAIIETINYYLESKGNTEATTVTKEYSLAD